MACWLRRLSSLLILIVSEQVERRAIDAAATERAGYRVVTAELAGTAVIAQRARPDILMIDVADDTATLRGVLERARVAAKAQLLALVVLPESSVWLRAPLPLDMAPAVTLSHDGVEGGELARACGSLLAEASPSASHRAGGLTFEPGARAISGRGGVAALTPSEAAVMALFLERAGEAVPIESFTRTLWDRATADRRARAAIRSHIHTLRRKMQQVGAGDPIVSVTGVGYRFEIGGY